MFELRAISFALCGLLLAACAMSPHLSDERPALSKQKLDEAGKTAAELTQLEQLEQPKRSDYRRRAVLRDRLWQFEREVIRTAIRLEQEDNWDGAEQVFLLAINTVPDSHILRSARFQFNKRRAVRKEVLRAELAIHQGEQLLQDASVYDSLQRVTPVNSAVRREISAHERRRTDSAKSLKQFAKRALERDDYYLARRCLSLSYRLREDEDVKQNLITADAYIRRIRQRVESDADAAKPAKSAKPMAKVAASEKPDTELLVGAFYHALNKGDFLLARTHLSELQQLYPRYRNLISMNSQYRLKLNRHVNQALEEGKELYAAGKVEQALNVWVAVQPLAPNNVELLSSISRAEKVLENLKMLSTQQSADNSS